MRRVTRIQLALALFSVATVLSAGVPPPPPSLPPLPSALPVPSATAEPENGIATPSPVPPPTVIRRPRFSTIRPPSSYGGYTNSRPIAARSPYVAPAGMKDDVISWDAITKEYTAKPGDLAAKFTFSLTNVSKTNVVINWVKPSCGCTVAKLPPTPWTLTPGESGNIDLSVDLRGKFGTLSKYVSVDSTAGQKLLNLKIVIPSTPQLDPAIASRSRNMQMAMGDRQAVFRGDCARCHVTPTAGKTGEALYQTACGICHEAAHRASMVPDLRALKVPTNKEFWAQWAANGKPGSLMPAFSKTMGGPLTDEQIQSLAAFLDSHFPSQVTASAALPSSPTH